MASDKVRNQDIIKLMGVTTARVAGPYKGNN
jgi:hypothetical protein